MDISRRSRWSQNRIREDYWYKMCSIPEQVLGIWCIYIYTFFGGFLHESKEYACGSFAYLCLYFHIAKAQLRGVECQWEYVCGKSVVAIIYLSAVGLWPHIFSELQARKLWTFVRLYQEL